MSEPIFSFKSTSNTAQNSDLKRLFQSRRTISQSDRRVISQYLLTAEDDVKKCEADVKRLLVTMKTLESRKKGLERTIEQYRSLLSPIHRLPSEILVNVFRLCCADNTIIYCDRKTALIELTKVCGRWRDIALSSPTLWSRLELWALGDPSPNLEKSLTELTNLFVERSQNMPLTLVFQCDLGYPVAPMILAFHRLAKHSQRWLDVSFVGDAGLLDDSTFSGILDNIPVLKHLQLPWDTFAERPNMFSDAPSLVSLHCIPRLHSRLVIPWAQIKDLTMYRSSSKDALSLLKQCPEVEELELLDVGARVGDVQDPRPIVLERVRSLIIQSAVTLNFTSKFVTLPLLTTLKLDRIEERLARAWEDKKVLSCIDSFLLRSQCTITLLQLRNVMLEDHQVVALLKLLPGVETLSISDYLHSEDSRHGIVTSRFLEQLTVEVGWVARRSHVVPRLSSLILEVLGKALDIAALSNLVVSRWKPSTDSDIESLSSIDLTVYGGSEHYLRQLDWLEEYRAAGLLVKLNLP